MAGCERQGAGDPAPAPTSPVAAEAAATAAPDVDQQAVIGANGLHEAAPMFDGTYVPVSRTAESITDDITFENDTIQFGFGHTYETTPESMIRQGDAAGRGFTEALSVPAGAYIEIRKVTSELVNARAVNGGLCRPDETRWLVFAAVRDDQDVTDQVAMAAYKGVSAPTPAAADRELCGTFTYARANR
jgi:hypothetical protein